MFLPMGIAIFMCCLLNAQEDSIKYQNTRVYVIENGNKTEAFHVSNQKTFSAIDDRLIREVNFDDSTTKIQDYTFYFYRNGKLFTEESYSGNDTLIYIIRHEYNDKGLEENVNKLERINGILTATAKTVYVYDSEGQILYKKEFSNKKRPFRVTHYLYSSGNLIREQQKSKKTADGIALRIIDYQYAPDGKLKSKSMSEKNTKKVISVYSENHQYNDNGDLKIVEKKDVKGNIIVTRNFEYYANGSLRNYYETDRDGKMLIYYSYIYKYHKINLGNQRSYFDKT
jgi:hypothetical protein